MSGKISGDDMDKSIAEGVPVAGCRYVEVLLLFSRHRLDESSNCSMFLPA